MPHFYILVELYHESFTESILFLHRYLLYSIRIPFFSAKKQAAMLESGQRLCYDIGNTRKGAICPMKKSALILVFALLTAMLAGCGTAEETPDTTSSAIFVTLPALQDTPEPVDTSDMHHYDLACGLSFYGPGSLKEKRNQTMAAYLDSGFFLVMVIEEPKTGTVLENATAQEYADMLTGNNNLEPCVIDRYGNLATCYVADSVTGDSDFFYYVTIKETAGSFWLVQFVCPGEAAEEHVDNMAKWSSTFVETPADE